MSTPDAGRWTLRRRLGQAFVALAVILVGLGILISLAVLAFVHAGNDVINRWQPAASRSQQVLDDLVNQETGIRGYALTHLSNYLEPYHEYSKYERTDLARVTTLIGDDAELRVLLGRFETAANQWRTVTVVRMIADAKAGRTTPIAVLDDGKARFDRIRVRAKEFVDAVQHRVRKAHDARTRDGIIALITAIVAVVIVSLTGAVVWLGLHRWVLGPIDGLALQVRDVATGNRERRIVGHGPVELTDLGGDVEAMRMQIATERDRAETSEGELRVQGAELARSNDDLQQFAYVASHDLSEPLRKVANFCQLLERQYGDQLDDRAKQYIYFAVDGAKRMQALITDLLAFSRVGRTTESFEPVDLDKRLDQALLTLRDRIEESGAVIERPTSLPTVDGDQSLLTSLFENLVGNAIKYRRTDVVPRVRVDVEADPEQRRWVFSVSDNGIGIDRQYAERIFVVFQRLHLRDKYGGTGIGLALCRKIVEFHGGQIWLADVGSSQGATFRFTLPERGRVAQPRD